MSNSDPEYPAAEPATDARPDTEGPASELARATDILPSALYLLPLTERPLFPAQTLPVLLNEEPWLETVEKVGESAHHVVGLASVRRDNAEGLAAEDFYSMGSAMRMHHPMRHSGKIQFIAEGLQRFRIVGWLSKTPPFQARVEYPMEPAYDNLSELKAYALAIINTLKDLVPLNPLYSEELKFFLNRFGPNEPSPLTDFAINVSPKRKLHRRLS